MASADNDPSLQPVLRVRLLRADARLPRYQTSGAAGLDLEARPADGAPISIPLNEVRLIPTGLAVAVPIGFEGQVRPRSGLATRHLVTLPNTPGTIDSDYRGELLVPLVNLGPRPFVVEPGMRIAQLVIAPVTHVRIIESDDLEATVRGTGGFGSTGLVTSG